MDQVTVDIQQDRAIVLLIDDMAFEDFVIPLSALAFTLAHWLWSIGLSHTKSEVL
jgi:hypothetical protein